MKLAFPFVLISGLLLLSCGDTDRKKAAAASQKAGPRPPARVDVYIARTASLTDGIELSGTVIAGETTEIHPEASGRLVSLNVSEGAVVGAGAVLARVSDADLQAQLRKLSAQLRQAQTTADRYAQLQKIGGISAQESDVARLQISTLQADMALVRAQLAKTVVRAPYSGRLGFKTVGQGAYVTPASIITTIQKTTGLQLEFPVPERYVAQTKPGTYVNFTIEGSSRAYTAVVKAADAGIDEATRSLRLRADVRGDAGGLVPGAFARIRVQFDPKEAIMVPSQAIVSGARGKKLYVLRSGKAAFVDVSTGIRDSTRVEIVEGLKAGDSVIVTGLQALKPDAPVKVGKVL